MIEPILLVGLIALFVAHRKAVARIERLEAALGQSQRHAPPAEALTPSPAPERPAEPIAPSAPPVPRTSPPMDMLGPRLPEIKTQRDRLIERETIATLFERFVGGRLLIWIGGIALAVAGVFLVRYSIEIGLITPSLRMIAAAIFGVLLIAGGEYARRHPGSDRDPRIGQALVGAGILVLYAASYGALVLYGLIGLGTATVLMGLTTVAALLLSLRHGEPTAAMGLIGGFLTPLLVGDPESGAVPLLAYLGLLNIALYALAQRKGWTWLAAGAALLSFLWTGALMLAPTGDALAAGVFIIVLSIAASLVRPGEGRMLRLLRPGAIGLLQLSVLVARTDLDLSAWILFAILAAAGLWLSVRSPDYRLLPPAALLLALVLLLGEATGGSAITPAVAAGISLLFAGFAYPRAAAGDSRLLPTVTASIALAAPVLILRFAQEDLLPTWAWAALLLALAAATASLIWRQRAHASERIPPDAPLLAAAACMAALLLPAGYDLVPTIAVPGLWTMFAIGMALAARRLRDSALTLVSFAIALLAGMRAVPLAGTLWEAGLRSLAGDPVLAADLPAAADGVTLLGVSGGLMLVLAIVLPPLYPRARPILLMVGGVFAAASAYILFKRLFGLSSAEDFVGRGFAERLLITQALFLAGWLAARRGWTKAAGLLTGLAAARLVWFDLVVHNPALVAQNVGPWPVANLLLPAFIGSAAWLYTARRRTGDAGASGTWLALALLALISGAMLLVRQAFQGAILTQPDMPLSEFYGYSLIGLLLAAAVILAGVRLPDKALRAAGLALLTATIFKVFVVDASALEGLLRILSFLGLGVALIGIGKLYGTVLNKEAGYRSETA